MKVMYIDDKNQLPCHYCGSTECEVVFGSDYEVKQSIKFEDSFTVKGLEMCVCGVNVAFIKKRFSLLSDIDERELLEQREQTLINI